MTAWKWRLVVVGLFSLAACPPSAPTGVVKQPEQTKPAEPVASVGVTDSELAQLLRDHWDFVMRTNPEWATSMGDRRFDQEITQIADSVVKQARVEMSKFFDRGYAISKRPLNRDDALTLRFLLEQLSGSLLVGNACESHLWSLSARNNLIVEYNYLPESHRIENAEHASSLLARYRKIPAAIDAGIANLQTGLAQNLVANAESVTRAIAVMDAAIAKPVETWPQVLAAAKLKDSLPADVAAGFLKDVIAEMTERTKPAYQKYRDFVHKSVLPRARPAANAGLGGLGKAGCYSAQIARHLGLPKTADELHQVGITELERVNREMVVLGNKLFPELRDVKKKLARLIAKLRTDTSLYFTTPEDIVKTAERSLAAAIAVMPKQFGRRPLAACVVKEIPDYEAPFSTIAYYRAPHADGNKPGEYFINTYAPKTRPRFEAQVLAFHESIPGHHLQIALAQELGAQPAIRKYFSSTAFVEGWGLYSERLADEAGLYTGDLDRMGMLSFDAWRAARLVVDTGLHAKGWTRTQAEAFMTEHTALTTTNIVNEVDRYLTTPGQALAYKVGQLEILRLRKHAKDTLGDRFDLRKFHDTVLGSGAVTLEILADNIAAWIKKQGR